MLIEMVGGAQAKLNEKLFAMRYARDLCISSMAKSYNNKAI